MLDRIFGEVSFSIEGIVTKLEGKGGVEVFNEVIEEFEYKDTTQRLSDDKLAVLRRYCTNKHARYQR